MGSRGRHDRRIKRENSWCGTVLRKGNIFFFLHRDLFHLFSFFTDKNIFSLWLQLGSLLDCAPINQSFTGRDTNRGNADILQHMSCCFGL